MKKALLKVTVMLLCLAGVTPVTVSYTHLLDNIVHSAVKADQFQHAACHPGDDDEFAHSGDSCSHGAKPVE